MKRLYLVLLTLMVIGVLIVMQSVSEAEFSAKPDSGATGVVKTATGAVKASSGVLYGVKIFWTDYNVGDSVKVLNGATDSSTSLLNLYPTHFDTTHALYSCEYSTAIGIYYATAIYVYRTQASGDITMDFLYR